MCIKKYETNSRRNGQTKPISVFSFLFAGISVALSSCSDFATDDAYVFPSTSALVNSGQRVVKLQVSSSEALLSVSSSRTITPAAYSASELDFYLGGKNIGTNQNLAVQKVNFVADANSSSSGSITIPLNSYNYQLVLLAIPNTTSITLSGDSVIDGTLLENQTFSSATSESSPFTYSNNSVSSGIYILCVVFFLRLKFFRLQRQNCDSSIPNDKRNCADSRYFAERSNRAD